jgi:hypothetical protein
VTFSCPRSAAQRKALATLARISASSMIEGRAVLRVMPKRAAPTAKRKGARGRKRGSR